MSTLGDVTNSFVAGTTRALASAFVVQPLDTLKLHCQMQNKPVVQTACELWKKSPTSFYEGSQYFLPKKLLVQAVAWPIVLQGDEVLEHLSLDTKSHPIIAQALKAEAIVCATIALGGAELDRKRVSQISQKTTSPLQGLKPIFVNGSVRWTSFLVGQDQYRKLYRDFTQKQELSLTDQTFIGTLNALTVGTLSAIPDRWQTLSISQNATLAQVRKTRNPQAAVLNVAALWVNNVLSIFWIEHFSKKPS